MNRLKRISVASRTVYLVVIGALILIGLYAFFNSRIGQAAFLVCCGGAVLVVILGIVSERGMRRPK